MLKRWMSENKGMLAFLLCMLFVRSAIADWYSIPSSSMYPTLLIGDRVVSNRLAYDIKLPFTDIIVKRMADPKRGDIVTFTSPQNGKRLVKRLVAVPGDVVEMHNDKLIINGIPASYSPAQGVIATHFAPEYAREQRVLNEELPQQKHCIIVMPQRVAARDFGPVTIPDDEYLMLGDNRDNSADSRYIGFVNRELLTGRVERIAFSLDTEQYYLPRIDRFMASAQQ